MARGIGLLVRVNTETVEKSLVGYMLPPKLNEQTGERFKRSDHLSDVRPRCWWESRASGKS